MSDKARLAVASPQETSPPGPPAHPPASEAPTSACPPYRRLRAYAFDPSLDTQLETAVLNRVTLEVPWDEGLAAGPVGEYLEVVDHDPAGGCYYEPVDLNQPHLLARDGLAPSEGNPQFHQQMVYAVAMTTIRNFERALGRRVLWAPRRGQEDGAWREEYVGRLRIYPHALREANAYYSPEKKALLFGYFPASRTNPGSNLPGGLVFTCLSHDVVAHETTHALLDGMHRRFIEASNPDVLAFHEAFADIVALFQHFSFPDVLRAQIARTRGDLASQNLLGQLAQQFGQAIGQYGALRDALGRTDPATGEWTPLKPNPADYQKAREPHARGAILVAAVFDAFVSIYKSRVADLLRIASAGSGVLPAGELHPDLVNRLASEAAKSSRHVLTMCVRALDYIPPIDITFGEYLRALVTADYDLVPDDDRGYRIAVIEAFRRRGIYPAEVRTLSVDNLRWEDPSALLAAGVVVPDVLLARREALRELLAGWNLSAARRETYDRTEKLRADLHGWFQDFKGRVDLGVVGAVTGLALDDDAPQTIERDAHKQPKFEVHSVRPARRVGPDGDLVIDLVVEVTQRRKGYLDARMQERADKNGVAAEADFFLRGGCTMLVDMETGKPRYFIRKSITARSRLERQRQFLSAPQGMSLRASYFGPSPPGETEPFALLHRDA